MKKSEKPTQMPSKNKNTSIDSVLKYVFAALLFFIPLYPKFPLFNVPGTYVAIRVEDFIIAILALLLFTKFFKKPSTFFKPTIFRFIYLYLAIGLIATLSGIFLTHTTSPSLGLLHWARRVEYIIPFFAAYHLTQNRDNLIFFLKLLPFIAAGVFAYGIAQIYFYAPVISTQNDVYAKGVALRLQPGVNLSSTFAGHYDLATYLVMTISLFLSSLAAIKNRKLKILSAILLLPLFWFQLKTGSRIAFGAIILSSTLILVISKKPFWLIPLYIVAVIGLINTPSISGRFGSLFNIFRFTNVQQKVKGAFDSKTSLIIKPAFAIDELDSTIATPTPVTNERAIQQDRSTSIRLDIEWPRALRAFYKNPFYGTGYSSISLATDNDYLRAIGETGLLGFLAWLMLIISTFTSTIKNLSQKKLIPIEKQYLRGILGLILGFMFIATFIDVFEASKVATLFWMYTGLAVGLKRS